MNIKIFSLTVLLSAILMLALKMNSPIFVMGIIFLPASFLASLSAGSQSFTLARLPFLFINGIVFFLLCFRNNLSGDILVAISAVFNLLVLWATNYFAVQYKLLPNIASEDYENFASKYEVSRNMVFTLLLFAVFVWCINAFVIYSIFGYSFYLVLLIIFFVTFLFTSLIFRIYSAPRREKENFAIPAIYSWAISLIIIQISWIIGFWPFGYLTAAFIITIIYYVTLSAVKEYFFGKMEVRRIAKEFLFGVAVAAVVFYFIRWLPA